jgi:tetratricopeptide (TPR) repeat protein
MEKSSVPDIQHLPLFCDLHEHARGYLQSRLREFTFSPKQLIIEAGKRGNFLGVVGTGLVDLEKPDGQIQTLLPGEMFGEQMLLFKQPCPYTVRSRSEANLWVITRSDWLQALQITAPAPGKPTPTKKGHFPYSFIGLLILLVCSLIFLSPELPQWSNQLIIESLLNANRADLAESYLNIGIQYNPASAALREAMGYLQYSVGDISSAGAYYAEAVKLDEFSASARNNLGAVMLNSGKPEDALDELKKAVELDPGNPETFFNLGSVYLSLGDLDQAAESFRRATELKPDYLDAKIQLAAVLMRLDKFPEASMVWEEILYWSPEQPVARLGRGVISVLENRPQDSIPDLEAALMADPVDPYAHFYLGLALNGLQNQEQARIEFETVKVLSQNLEMRNLADFYLNSIAENPQ